MADPRTSSVSNGNTLAEGRKPHNSVEFRSDINGLRAIAVTAVILYHFGLAGFSGGYAGVDVFFVISGFLMTGIILTRLQKNTFSFADFYLARARRIIPALLVVCIVLLSCGYFWLIPSDYKTLGEHVSGATAFVSNFIFKGEDGYFNAPLPDKWMLHTWSLSVEWQFYLLYPVLLIGVKKYFKDTKKVTIRMLSILVLLSLTASVLMTSARAAFTFYLLPARMWEFIIGAFVYMLSQGTKTAFGDSKGAELFGLTLIFASFFIFDNYTLWPGYAVILPVLGTAFVILAARKNPLVTGNSVAQWVGKSSYSLYLWHWPVFVAFTYFGVTDRAWSVIGVLCSLILGAASYVFVEIPSRAKMASWPKKLAMGRLIAVMSIVICCGIVIYTGNGLPGRVSAKILDIDKASALSAAAVRNCISGCRIGDGKSIDFVVWGDSHADVISDAIATASKTGGIVYTIGCPTIFNTELRRKKRNGCKAYNDRVFEAIKALPPQVPVIIANRYAAYSENEHNQGLHRITGLRYIGYSDDGVKKDEAGMFRKKLTETLCTIAVTRRVYAVQPIAEMGQSVPKTMARRLMAGREASDPSDSKEAYALRNKDVLEALHTARDQCGVKLLDPLPYLCTEKECPGALKGRPLYFDDDHLNPWGSQFLVPMFKNVFQSKADP